MLIVILALGLACQKADDETPGPEKSFHPVRIKYIIDKFIVNWDQDSIVLIYDVQNRIKRAYTFHQVWKEEAELTSIVDFRYKDGGQTVQKDLVNPEKREAFEIYHYNSQGIIESIEKGPLVKEYVDGIISQNVFETDEAEHVSWVASPVFGPSAGNPCFFNSFISYVQSFDSFTYLEEDLSMNYHYLATLELTPSLTRLYALQAEYFLTSYLAEAPLSYRLRTYSCKDSTEPSDQNFWFEYSLKNGYIQKVKMGETYSEYELKFFYE